MIGNSLFFMISSFGLFLSFQKKEPQNFTIWYSDRVKRIYPSVWITLLLITMPVNIIMGKFLFENFFKFTKGFICPPFWFLQALMIFYFFSWFVFKKYSEKKLITLIILSITIYFYLYLTKINLSVFSLETQPFRLIYYFIVSLFGMHIANNNEKLNYSGTMDIIISLICVAGIYSHKFIITKGVLTEYQFIQHFLCIILCYYLFKISRSGTIKEKIMKNKYSKPIRLISRTTLEIYIVHVSISGFILSFNFQFPLNIVIFLCSTFSISIILHYLSNSIFSTKKDLALNN